MPQSPRSKSWRTRRALGATLLLAPLPYAVSVEAATEDPGASMFSLSGFGTFGLVHSSEERADFIANLFQATGAGFPHAWSSDVDTKLGAQVAAHFTPQLTAVLQLIAEQNYNDTYRPHVEWANIAYQVTPELTVRAGRIVLASFLYSDTRKVGYALPWVRPPIELYSLVPINGSDGVDVRYRLHFGDAVNTAVVTYGSTQIDDAGGGRSYARRQWAITDTLEYGSATVYATFHEAHLTFTTLNTLFDAFRHFGPQGAALADRFDENDTLLQFFGLGGDYDPGKWFVAAEWGKSNLHSALGVSTAWYVSGGYRWATFTPYLTYGAVRADSNTSDPGLNVAALPPFLSGPATSLNAALNGILGSIAVQTTISAGTRWDLARNIDLKLQFDHTRLGAGSPGTLSNLQPGFQPGGSVNLVTVAIDFVW